jgi:hypothetical protein
MESPEGTSGDALIAGLEDTTSHLETQIGAFRLVGKDIQGDMEHGFFVQSPEDTEVDIDETLEEIT